MRFSPQPTSSELPETQTPASRSFCKIVTFYEEFADAIRAVQKFEEIVQALSGDRPVIATSWSFDMLGKHELNTIILEDVSHADVIVVASHGNRGLPGRIASWVGICTAAVQAKQPVLVALHNDEIEADGVAAPLCKSLKDIASHTDASVMCNHDLAHCVERRAQQNPRDYGRDVRHSAAEPAQFAVTENLRWWGIND